MLKKFIWGPVRGKNAERGRHLFPLPPLSEFHWAYISAPLPPVNLGGGKNHRPNLACRGGVVFALLLVVMCVGAFAQDRQRDAYTVPSKVYVGDRASLVLPLPGIAGAGNIKINLDHIPTSPELDIHQITLERRPGGSFLTIEFSAYTAGVLELPPIDVAGEIFSGLKIEISSILAADDSDTVLSGPALPLAIPGTSLLIYGAISAVIAFLLIVVWVLVWGRTRLKGWVAAWKRRRLLAAMMGTEKRLHHDLAKGIACREILDALSTEFRAFLAGFTGENYRAMTAAEIRRFKDMGEGDDVLGSEFLGGFFDHCDGIRFSGDEIRRDEISAMLGDLRRFLAALDHSVQGKAVCR